MAPIRILYEDPYLVLCVKPVGVLSEDSPSGACMPGLLREHYRALGQNDYIATVHRLDRLVGGVMLFSRRRDVTGKLTAAVAEHRVTKEYLAVLGARRKRTPTPSPTCCSVTPAHNKSYVVTRMRKGVREARLDYTPLAHHDGRRWCASDCTPAAPSDPRPVLPSGTAPAGRRPLRQQGPLLPGPVVLPFGPDHPVTGQPLDVTCPPPDTYPWTDFSPLKEMVSLEV